MRFLITGITGFSGRHLAARLIADGSEVFGTTRRLDAAMRAGLGLPPDHLFGVALEDAQGLIDVLRQVRPHGVFHLAALTSVAASFADPPAAYRTNLLGSLNLFAAAQPLGDCRVVWVGSCDAYGAVEAHELPATETTPFRPLSPYAVSKAAADLAAYQWGRVNGLQIVRMRSFNHTGPGQAPHFVCADFARQLIEVERGTRQPRLRTGNLDVVRDFSDVRDVVRAYVAAWQHGESGQAYNVCSEVGRSPRAVLEDLMRLSGVEATVTTEPQRQRQVEVPTLVGSAAKLRAATGWAPTIPWEHTLRDLLDDWRTRSGC